MSKLFIPSKSQVLTVNKDWEITLYPSVSNISVGVSSGNYKGDENYGFWINKDGENAGYHPYKIDFKTRSYNITYPIVIPKDTKLSFGEIKYRDNGGIGHTRVGFSIKSGEHKGTEFWVTVDDANTLEYDV